MADDKVKIFISHSHADKAIADALKALIVGVFSDDWVVVSYSSDRAAGGGIAAGAEWLPWILREVRESGVCIVMLTPESLGRPWLMWETGAVTGVALGSQTDTPIVPLLYRVTAESIPSPLAARQAEYGDSEEGIDRVLQLLHQRIGKPQERFFRLAAREELPTYFTRVTAALQTRPMALTEGAVQEWCERIDELRKEGRFSEVVHLHAALLRVFAPPDQKEAVPLDVRLHRRLGDMYLAARIGARAAEQFDLALRLVPNDMFLKHRLALAHVEAGNAGQARQILTEMEHDDPELSSWNPEIAGLKGRIYRDEWKRTGSTDALRAARDAYWLVMEKQPDSYYMADNVGQLSLALGETEKAGEAFRRAIDAVARLKERSVWSLATLANAWLVIGDQKTALDYLCAISELAPTPRELESIEGGLRRICEGLKMSEQTLDGWLQALRGIRVPTFDPSVQSGTV